MFIPGPQSRLSGLILFDKPSGWTSHDAAQAVRRMLPKGVKVGHCGALDPIATGLLILLVGRMTRFQAKLQGLDKVYTGLIRLGLHTDTGDIAGKIVEERPVPDLTNDELDSHMKTFIGRMETAAPAYSAVKYRGVPLYKYARRGIPVPPRMRINLVHEWSALGYKAPDVEHRVSCSSGTYVRSMAELLGARLGCGAAVLTLRRERIAHFPIDQALTLDVLKGMSNRDLRTHLDASLDRLRGLEDAKPTAASA